MDFEHAARRLARESKAAASSSRRRTPAGGAALSAKAKREAEMRKKQQARIQEERRKRQRRQEFLEQYMRQCDRTLGVKSLQQAASAAASAAAAVKPKYGDASTTTNSSSSSSSTASSSLQLQATSIHGEGDKIALPPSVLEYLTQSQLNNNAGAADESSSFTGPWTFRIGILNPQYNDANSSNFPASPLLQTMKIPDDDDDDDDSYMDDSDSEDDENNENSNSPHSKAAYLDELNHKYLAYTHGTVVEFTQDENCVGLPQPIASALLAGGNGKIPIKRTVDPSAKKSSSSSMAMEDGDHDEQIMKIDDDEQELTPGHLAWGAFDVPDMPIEVSLVQLPRGKACTLTPTVEAVQRGFYNLKNIKLVLEQSLIRTRATLSVGDTVHTWHRGTKYDLTVSKVTPSAFRAIRCINTDLEVDFGHVELPEAEAATSKPTATAATEPASSSDPGYSLSGGRVLSASSSPVPPATATDSASTATAVNVEKLLQSLPAEPPMEQSQGVCTVMIRGSGSGGKNGRRRFDVETATVHDLFTFAKSILADSSSSGASIPSSFRLVTRMPRRVLEDPSIADGTTSSSSTLSQVGIQQGQELFMIEFQ